VREDGVVDASLDRAGVPTGGQALGDSVEVLAGEVGDHGGEGADRLTFGGNIVETGTDSLAIRGKKDIGDLAMLVQASEGVRQVTDLDKALGHELSDCLWSVIALADRLGIDLEAAFTETMDELDQRLRP
jgi:hypothetical protein